jgi:hypothetical protein
VQPQKELVELQTEIARQYTFNSTTQSRILYEIELTQSKIKIDSQEKYSFLIKTSYMTNPKQVFALYEISRITKKLRMVSITLNGPTRHMNLPIAVEFKPLTNELYKMEVSGLQKGEYIIICYLNNSKTFYGFTIQ